MGLETARATLPEEPRALAAEVVRRWGRHPAPEFGIDLGAGDDPVALGHWLVAACLLDGRTGQARASEAFERLAKRGWHSPRALATADPVALTTLLRESSVPKPPAASTLLVRVATAAADGSPLVALSRECGTLDELGGALSRLAPGFGRAAVVRFLQPLRDLWPAAGELPLDPAARAAAVHLGLLNEGQDEDGEPSALRARLRGADTPLADVEAALARLGRLACLRNARHRCPLEGACPAAPIE